LARKFGSKIWLEDLARKFGSKIWLEDLARKFGTEIWMEAAPNPRRQSRFGEGVKPIHNEAGRRLQVCIAVNAAFRSTLLF
jgi:hypothetical protein